VGELSPLRNEFLGTPGWRSHENGTNEVVLARGDGAGDGDGQKRVDDALEMEEEAEEEEEEDEELEDEEEEEEERPKGRRTRKKARPANDILRFLDVEAQDADEDEDQIFKRIYNRLFNP